MNIFKKSIVLTSLLLLGNCANLHTKDTTTMQPEAFTIAFGSCAVETREQPVWNEISVHQPDLFLFIGDNQYADLQEINGEKIVGPVTDPKRFAQAYNTLSAIPEFAAFRKQVPSMMGTWDDHDYGANDAGKEFPLKQASQSAFFDFFNFAKSDPIRQQAGIYHAQMFEQHDKRVQVIMLDTRYNRDALLKNPNGLPQGKGPYIPSYDANLSILGETQWKWLWQELKKPADVRILVSSIQVVAHEHLWEGWGTMPMQRQALYDLIQSSGANGLVFLSGDRHLMEISKDTGQLGAQVPYPMWDFTSSGLTQDFYEVNEDNTYRIGQAVRDTNYGIVTINWHQNDIMQSTISLKAYGLNQRLLESVVIPLSELQL